MLRQTTTHLHAKTHFAGNADVLVRNEREARNNLLLPNTHALADEDVRAPSIKFHAALKLQHHPFSIRTLISA